MQAFEIVGLVATIAGLVGSAIGFSIKYLWDQREIERGKSEEAVLNRLLPFYSILIELQSKLVLL
jgi:hypothetical protein